MHLFGFLGAIFFFIGFAISFYLAIEKFAFDEYQMTQRPIFYMALVAMILGTQLFLAGFIGELISRNSPERNVYLVEDQIL
jgi:hypothetical protein